MKVFFVRHGETQANVEKRPYKNIKEPLTENGISQAIKAGKYLKTFGKFDLVISSPATRSIQTAENIIKEIGYDKKIKIDELILEKLSTKVAGLNADECKDIIKKAYKEYPELIKIETEFKNVKDDPFKRIEFFQKNIDKWMTLRTGEEAQSKQFNKHKKFLNNLKKLNKKCILVVGHGGTINYMTRIITNTYLDGDENYPSSISVIPTDARIKCIDKKHDVYNTSIMACLIKNNKVNLVIAPNTAHLYPELKV
uniref:Histidine phosphatase family protein n=1 Tax=viral metagenome TaxID=1070528 RepID=A0A6C0EC00_9ZZZZ